MYYCRLTVKLKQILILAYLMYYCRVTVKLKHIISILFQRSAYLGGCLQPRASEDLRVRRIPQQAGERGDAHPSEPGLYSVIISVKLVTLVSFKPSYTSTQCLVNLVKSLTSTMSRTRGCLPTSTWSLYNYYLCELSKTREFKA
jgi:hypothetical protein